MRQCPPGRRCARQVRPHRRPGEAGVRVIQIASPNRQHRVDQIVFSCGQMCIEMIEKRGVSRGPRRAVGGQRDEGDPHNGRPKPAGDEIDPMPALCQGRGDVGGISLGPAMLRIGPETDQG